jgi:hypothetical protein
LKCFCYNIFLEKYRQLPSEPVTFQLPPPKEKTV